MVRVRERVVMMIEFTLMSLILVNNDEVNSNIDSNRDDKGDSKGDANKKHEQE